MTAIPTTVFAQTDLRLRVWFNDGTNGSQRLSPDQRLAPTAYLAANSVTTATIADAAIRGPKIAAGAVTGTQVATNTLDASRFAVVGPPNAGQVLGFNGTGLTWTAPGGGVFSLNGTSAYYNGGNVGIGTNVPATKLEVKTGTGLPGFTHTDGTIRVGSYVGGSTSGATGGWLGTISNHALHFFVNNGQPAMTVDTAGNVGIGTATPSTKLELQTAINEYGFTHTNGTVTLSEYIGNSTTVASGAWLGTNTAFPLYFYANNGNPGITLSTAGNVGIGFTNPQTKLDVNGTIRTKVLTITGGADVAEPFPMKEEELEKGSVVVIDDKHPGRLKRSASAYDRRVAGIVSGANGIHPGIALQQEGAVEGGRNVALSGRVYVQADASGGPIKPGDLLTTSYTPGHAMKVTNHARSQGAVIGKAMSSLNEGSGMVLVLVTLQ